MRCVFRAGVVTSTVKRLFNSRRDFTPHSVRMHRNHAVFLFEFNRLDEAEWILLTALHLDPGDPLTQTRFQAVKDARLRQEQRAEAQERAKAPRRKAN